MEWRCLFGDEGHRSGGKRKQIVLSRAIATGARKHQVGPRPRQPPITVRCEPRPAISPRLGAVVFDIVEAELANVFAVTAFVVLPRPKFGLHHRILAAHVVARGSMNRRDGANSR